MSGDELADGLRGAAITICNDYEFELIRQKTGLDEEAVVARTGALVVTRGEHGSSIRQGDREVSVPAVPPHAHRRSDRRRRRVPRRAAEGAGDG